MRSHAGLPRLRAGEKETRAAEFLREDFESLLKAIAMAQ
jgi:hypothetical protein